MDALTDFFILSHREKNRAMIIPAKTDRNITMARDASNFQKRKDMLTTEAFWIENKTTNKTITINTIKVAINPSYAF